MTPMQMYKAFEKKVNMMDIGHGYNHGMSTTVEMLQMRLDSNKRLTLASNFIIPLTEILECMLFAAEDNAENMAKWFNSSSIERFTIKYRAENKIGRILNRRGEVIEASGIIVVLEKTMNRYGDVDFRIVTEYVFAFSDEMKKREV